MARRPLTPAERADLATRRPDLSPDLATRAVLALQLRNLGIPNARVDDIVRAGLPRRQIVAALVLWLRARPKAT